MVGLAIILIYFIVAVYQEINRKYWDYKGFFGWLISEMISEGLDEMINDSKNKKW